MKERFDGLIGVVTWIIVTALLLAGGFFIYLAFQLLENSIAVAGSAALGSALLVAGIAVALIRELARMNHFLERQATYLRYLAEGDRERREDARRQQEEQERERLAARRRQQQEVLPGRQL